MTKRYKSGYTISLSPSGMIFTWYPFPNRIPNPFPTAYGVGGGLQLEQCSRGQCSYEAYGEEEHEEQ